MNNHGICLVQGKLDENLAKRAEHYFSETKRVAKGIYMNFKYLFYYYFCFKSSTQLFLF